MKKSIIMLAIFAAFFSIISINEMKSETENATLILCVYEQYKTCIITPQKLITNARRLDPTGTIQRETACPAGMEALNDYFLPEPTPTNPNAGTGVINGLLHLDPSDPTAAMYVFEIVGQTEFTDKLAWEAAMAAKGTPVTY